MSKCLRMKDKICIKRSIRRRKRRRRTRLLRMRISRDRELMRQPVPQGMLLLNHISSHLSGTKRRLDPSLKLTSKLKECPLNGTLRGEHQAWKEPRPKETDGILRLVSKRLEARVRLLGTVRVQLPQDLVKARATLERLRLLEDGELPSQLL